MLKEGGVQVCVRMLTPNMLEEAFRGIKAACGRQLGNEERRGRRKRA
jgi:hypothetical protein